MRAALIEMLRALQERCAEEAYDGATMRLRAGADAHYVAQRVKAIELDVGVDQFLSKFPELGDGAYEALERGIDNLQRAIESHVRGGLVPPEVVGEIPYYAHRLNEYQHLVTELRETVHLHNRASL